MDAVPVNLVVHHGRLDRRGHIDDRLGLRRTALGGLAVADIDLRSRLVPAGGVDVDLERPDDVELLLCAPVHLDLPRIVAGVADGPDIVLLRSRSVLINVDFARVGIVRETSRDRRIEVFVLVGTRDRPQLLADLHVDLRLHRPHDVHEFVSEENFRACRLIEARVRDQERSACALERLQLVAVKPDVADLHVTLVLVIVPDLDAVRSIERHTVVAAERHGRT